MDSHKKRTAGCYQSELGINVSCVFLYKAETPYFGHKFFYYRKFSDLVSCMYCLLSEMLHCEFKRQEK